MFDRRNGDIHVTFTEMGFVVSHCKWNVDKVVFPTGLVLEIVIVSSHPYNFLLNARKMNASVVFDLHIIDWQLCGVRPSFPLVVFHVLSRDDNSFGAFLILAIFIPTLRLTAPRYPIFCFEHILHCVALPGSRIIGTDPVEQSSLVELNRRVTTP